MERPTSEIKKARYGLAVVLALVVAALPALATEGILIDGVSAGSAAERAGVKGGDRLVELGGQSIRSLPDIEAVMGEHQVGDEVRLTVVRDGKRVDLKLTLGGEPGGSPRMGVMLSMTPDDTVDRSKPISAGEREEILTTIALELRSGYLYEDKGNDLAGQVEKEAGDDRFAGDGSIGAFVSLVNGFLLEISNDKHLRLRYGAPPDESAGPRRVVRRDPEPGGHGPEPGQSPDPGHGPGGGSGDYGVREARILEGNIGYLDMGMFAGSEAAKPKIDEAMMSLAGTDALIIDLGRNGGGGPWMVRYLSGFLFPKTTHLTDTWVRGMDSPRERWTLEGQPTDAFVKKPVYILTSGRTFSAAESFTFGLVINNRVTLVGERTGGGGHFGDMVMVSPDLNLFMPRGRTYDSATGQGWEAEGIKPDIKVPYAGARDRAVEAIRATISVS
ncbi:MAG: PDZ domain-containing protein [Acidobacteria bacterium]|nr:MAG: PDZ domain-containing protein [Acidobacteriota bacterium]